VETRQSSKSLRASRRDTSDWSIDESAATSTCVFPTASRTARIVRCTPRCARSPRPRIRTGSASRVFRRLTAVLMTNAPRAPPVRPFVRVSWD
jgi:hypothetical protein